MYNDEDIEMLLNHLLFEIHQESYNNDVVTKRAMLFYPSKRYSIRTQISSSLNIQKRLLNYVLITRSPV